MKKERWKDIPKMAGHYQVSNLGRVRSIKKNRPNIILKPCPNKFYFYFVPCINGKARKEAIHRVVLMAFRRMPRPREQANHKDGDGFNNVLSNLEWVSPKENIAHATKRGSFVNRDKNVWRYASGEKNGNSKLTWAKVDQIRKLHIPQKFGSPRLARMFGVSRVLINLVVTHKIWTRRPE